VLGGGGGETRKKGENLNFFCRGFWIFSNKKKFELFELLNYELQRIREVWACDM
jgi:hypothetical protein